MQIMIYSVLGVTTDNYIITVDSYQRQLYQIEAETGKVHAIPLTKPYKGVALDINPITNKVIVKWFILSHTFLYKI